MHWQVHIPGDETGTQPWTTTVEAENWFSALRNAFSKHGLDSSLVSNLTCDIKPDRSVHVTDFVTRRIFVLRKIDGQVQAPPAQVPAPAIVPAPTTDTAAAPEPALPMDLPSHEAFFWRDEAPDDGSGIFYRERLIAVSPEVTVEDAGRLALAVFERLRGLGASDGGKLFVTVQIFDHVFESRSLRPPVAALAWKEWSPRKAKIEFPLSGAASVSLGYLARTSYPPVGAPPAATRPPPARVVPAEAPPLAVPVARQPEPVPEQPVDLVLRPATAPPLASPVARPVERPAERPAERPVDLVLRPSAPNPEPVPAYTPAPAPVPVPMAAAPAAQPAARQKARPTPGPMSAMGAGIEDKVVHAFERMHDLYSIRDHDGAARFALDLSREFVDCEAGSAMLITPGKYELYIAAAVGPVADRLVGRKMSLTKGIIGFATRAGAVITVSDPESDPRFHEEFDTLSGFVTRNVVCAPIQHEGRTIGAIELVNSPRPTGFLQSEANVLSYIAGSVGEYIDTSLPSREADFSDKEFVEFMPKRRSWPPGPKGAAARPAKTAARAAKAPAADRKPAPAAGRASKVKKKRKR